MNDADHAQAPQSPPDQEPGRPSLLARVNARLAHTPLSSLADWLTVAVKGFVGDQCLLRAAALTFTTVLSLVPLLAVAFSIAKGFGVQNTQFMKSILLQFMGKEDVVEVIIGYINNTNVRSLGMIGVGFLFFTVISLLGTVEKSFNSIWGVKTQRNLWRKFSDYLTVILICPLMLIIAMSATASVQSSALVQKVLSMSVFSMLYLVLLKMLPFITNWLALIFVYTFMPNTKVRFGAALVGAVVAGTIWQLTQWGYIEYQASFKSYNAIYGSFAQVPLFLLWMYISWIIVLLGAEICFALQHAGTFAREKRSGHYSFDDRVKLATLVLALLARAFERGESPPSNEQAAVLLNAPVKLVNDVLYRLAAERAVVRLESQESDVYAMARPPEKVRLLDVLVALSQHKESAAEAIRHDEFSYLNPLFLSLREAAYHDEHNLTLKEFAARFGDSLARREFAAQGKSR